MLPDPPLPEQRRIATILDTLDDAIRQTESLIAKLKQVKQGLLHDLLTRGIDENGEVRPMGVPDAGERKPNTICGRWDICALAKVADVRGGITLGRPSVPHGWPNIPYLRVANVQDGFISTNEMKTIQVRPSELEQYMLARGDVLMTEGVDFDKLGRGAVWDGRIEPCLHQNHIFRVRCDIQQLLPEFLAMVTGSEYGRRYFLSCSKQTTNLASINSTQLKAFPVPLPSVREQQSIVAHLSSVDCRTDVESEHLAKLLSLKSGLMDDLLTGRVRTHLLPEELFG